MSKQDTKSQEELQESPENNQDAQHSHDPRDRVKTPRDNGRDKSAEAGGGEESKHGRKQKGNVEDT
jgi:hypothetical protein